MNDNEFDGLAYTVEKLGQEVTERSKGWYPTLYDERQSMPTFAYMALALAGEAGELANLVKKWIRNGAGRQEELADEVADIFTYLLLFADECGINLIHAYRLKAIKVAERNNA